MMSSDSCIVGGPWASDFTLKAHSVRQCGGGRRLWLDVCRSLAIGLVVLIHATQAVFPRNELGLFEGSLFYSFAISIGRLGVPLFLLMTGWLVVGKRFDDARDVLAFYRRSLFSLLLTIEFWIPLIFLVRNYFGAATDFQMLLRQMLFLEVVPGAFWWYIPTIIPLYIMAPFISIVLDSVSPRALLVPISFVLLYGFAPRLLTVSGILFGIEWLEVSSTLSVTYAMGVYGLYMVLGFYCRRYWEKLAGVKTVWLVIVLSISIAARFLVSYSGKIDLWYSDFSVLVAGVALFILLRRRFEDVGFSPLRKAARFVSKTSFAVYFLHAAVLEQVAPMCRILPFQCSIKATCAFVVTAVTVYSLVGAGWMVLGFFPRARKVVFHA